MKTAIFDALLASPRLADLAPVGQQTLLALRIFVIARRRGQCPLEQLTARLGSAASARHAVHMAGVIGYIWPERFTLSPPCAPTLSFDEHLLAILADHAHCGHRPAFDEAARDLLCDDARDQLWREFTRLPVRQAGLQPQVHQAPPPPG